MQKTSEALQSVADLYDDHVRYQVTPSDYFGLNGNLRREEHNWLPTRS